ncbi:MAG TPA: DUF4159 domain-containing protein [Stellaceae bacterium]|nr:DUF4159 domain-containing protein [Stellaceae bacterium]
MLSLGPLAFAAPWLLLGLAALPALWWLLRVTPPAPRRVRFPALRLLQGLNPAQETPAKTPLWLLLLRLALAACVILALAQPLLNPRVPLAGGTLVIAIDDGWGSARHWDEMRAALDDLIDRARRAGSDVVLLETAPGSNAPPDLSLLRPEDAHAAAEALQPRPWPEDRVAALARLNRLNPAGVAETVWLSDGIDNGDAKDFAAGLEKFGKLRVRSESGNDLPRLLAPADAEDKDLTALVTRADPALPETLSVRALGDDGRLLARGDVTIPAGETAALARLDMPAELRNRATSIAIEGETSAGALLLLDERWKRRPVGILAPGAAAQPLLSGAYYLDKALTPFSEVREGEVGSLLQGGIAVLALPDGAALGDADKTKVAQWLEQGGTVLRFAGPLLAEQTADNLLPVTLRRGGRTLGGALSWEQPLHLAPFSPDSPFAGLAIPSEVTVSRQVLAEPTLDLASKTWARLADGTPLVTAEKRGKGWLVLVHTTSDPEWSNLAISGLMVEMLRRVVALSQGVSGETDKPLPPVEVLDGFGRLQAAPASAEIVPAGEFAKTLASQHHPPGFYGNADSRRALNLAPAVKNFAPLPELPGVSRETYARFSAELDFRPPLLALAFVMLLADLVAGLALRGLLPAMRRGAALLPLLMILAVHPARAAGPDDFAIKAASEFHLAYVLTGLPEVDAESRQGLAGLSLVLNQRTAIEAAEPMGVDVEKDELIFFPLLYWPVVEGEALPSAKAAAKLQRYLATGGTILFDTRDGGSSTPISASQAEQQLKRLSSGIEVPPLIRVPPDHVLTKSFYLMEEFPGRWAGGPLWVEPTQGEVNDGVASVIVGGNEWAGAWAVDAKSRPAYAVVPGGEEQREMAYRFGVNLVMYALTGNYKTDQVHVPAILERLGQ